MFGPPVLDALRNLGRKAVRGIAEKQQMGVSIIASATS